MYINIIADSVLYYEKFKNKRYKQILYGLCM